MRVYHFINREFGLDNLRRRRLKIARINETNDPFDLLAPSSKHRSIRQWYAATRRQLANSTGMLCFSRGWNNPVQWSHYADRHRGLCLGFDVPARMLMPVTYSEHRLNLNLVALAGNGPAAEAEVRKMLTTKYSHWQYENEMRLFVQLSEIDPETGLYFAEFSEHLALKSVTVGHTSTISRSELRQALGDLASEALIFKARLAFGSFDVVRQRNEKLWT